MPYALRIDDVTRDVDTGRVEFLLTLGHTPLPVESDRIGISFGNVQQTLSAIRDPDAGEHEAVVRALMLFMFRAIRRQVPDITGAQFRNAVRGTTITLDLDAATRAGAVTVA